MKQFDGREAELIHTLKTMCRRKHSSTIPCNYNSSKQSKIHHSRGAISTEARNSTRRTSTMNGRKIDAIARIAAASTLDDQSKAVKPEYVVDENQYDPTYSNNNNNDNSWNHGDDKTDDHDDDQSFWKSKESLALSFDSQDDDNDKYDDDQDQQNYNQDEDPSQIYSDEDDDSYDEDEGDTYYGDYNEEEEENESNIYDDDEGEYDDASEGSTASWDEKYGNSNNYQSR